MRFMKLTDLTGKMKNRTQLIVYAVILFGLSCKGRKEASIDAENVKSEVPGIVQLNYISEKPIFTGTGKETWDKNIRERGFILYDDRVFKMWYTGYNDSLSEKRLLGYATSNDGIKWERFSDAPLLLDVWVEDMQVLKHDDLYYMFAEGVNDISHLLTSNDGINWRRQGNLTILKTNGEPIDQGPYGTPTVWIEDGKKFLFYERNDNGVWLAQSEDFKTWKNVQDNPVLKKGPEDYDSGAVAANQIVKYEEKYYMLYHGTSNSDWMTEETASIWTSNIAMSDDLVHWEKYERNPIVNGDHSSPILVYDGQQYSLYTMHDQVYTYDFIAFP